MASIDLRYADNILLTTVLHGVNKSNMKFQPEKIKALRDEHKLSLNQLAIRMGNVCTATAINNWERGQSQPGSNYLPALAMALCVDIAYFFE